MGQVVTTYYNHIGVQPFLINVELIRIDGGSGTCLVQGGVPLKPGLLKVTEANLVSLLIGGVEQTASVEVSIGTHPDGSARSVFIQTYQTVNTGTPVSAVVRIRPARTKSMSKVYSHKRLYFGSGGDPNSVAVDDVIVGDTSGASATVVEMALKSNNGTHWTSGIAQGCFYLENQTGTFQLETVSVSGKQTNIATVDGDSEDCITMVDREALIVASDADYLVQWGTLGPLITEDNYPLGDARTFEDRFETAMDTHYAGTPWTFGQDGFYDRPWNHLQKWSVSGESKWFTRAIEFARWRYTYDKSNQQIFYTKMLNKYPLYLLTGAEEFLDCAKFQAARLPGAWCPPEYIIADLRLNDTEGRSMSRHMILTLTAWIIGDGYTDWEGDLPVWIDANEHHQIADGSLEDAWEHFATDGNPTTDWKELNYCGGMRSSALIRIYDWASAVLSSQDKQDLVDFIQNWVDFLYEDPSTPCWVESEKAFYYGAGPDDSARGYGWEINVPIENCRPLNGLIIDAVSFLYEATGLEKYKNETVGVLEGIADVTVAELEWFPKTANQTAFGTRNAIARIYG